MKGGVYRMLTYVPPMEKDDVLSCGEDRVWRVSMCAYF